ncbi:Acyl-phosphate:glycerol-3-phosphate O-acyltransferase PlsY (EC 2.3.1.n3) [hydrothermal vent metagenome]|uniref:Acyl-phosphate:glycerol-3-phosphate O-acyltransferase PlsY n=1 Tax=hydrothermal vent metagenome TaxID=652676 RepID=A0A3B0REE7_9ZZZZ
MSTEWFLAVAAGYFLGSIPFGVLLTRWFGLGDVRKIGSGNIGATNVLRSGRKDLAVATLLLDAGKSAAAFWLASHFIGGANPLFVGMIAAVAALIGHCYPVWLDFKGGKGVATFFGGLFIASWLLGLVVAGIWLVVAASTRMSSVAALFAVNAAPALALSLGRADLAVYSGVMALIISIRHLDNIRRLMAGTEPRFGSKNKK